MPIQGVPVVHRRAGRGRRGAPRDACCAVSDTSTLGLRSCGVWTRAEALTVLGRGQVDALVVPRTWQVPWRGVYADGGDDLDAEQRAWAAVLAGGGPSAERWPSGALPPGSGDCRSSTTSTRPPAVESTCSTRWPSRGGCPRQRWAGRELRPVRTTLATAELVRLPSGLCLTSPLRTLVDCAGLLAPDALVCAIDAALHRRLVTRQDLAAGPSVPARAGARSRALQAAVGLADGRAESPPRRSRGCCCGPPCPGSSRRSSCSTRPGGCRSALRPRRPVGAAGRRVRRQGGALRRGDGGEGPPPRPADRGVRLADRAGHLVRAAARAGRCPPADRGRPRRASHPAVTAPGWDARLDVVRSSMITAERAARRATDARATVGAMITARSRGVS